MTKQVYLDRIGTSAASDIIPASMSNIWSQGFAAWQNPHTLVGEEYDVLYHHSQLATVVMYTTVDCARTFWAREACPHQSFTTWCIHL